MHDFNSPSREIIHAFQPKTVKRIFQVFFEMRVPIVLDTKDGEHIKLVFDKKNLQFTYHTTDEYMYEIICDVIFILLI